MAGGRTVTLMFSVEDSGGLEDVNILAITFGVYTCLPKGSFPEKQILIFCF